MRKLLLSMIILSICGIGNSAVTIFRAVMIYKELVSRNYISNAPKLVIDNNPSLIPNAGYEVNGHYIVIFKTLLDIANEDMVATTLGHELGHAKYKHSGNVDGNTSRAQEYKADQLGQIYTERAGWNTCKGFRWLRRMPETITHPAGKDRYKRLNCTNRR